MDYAYKPTTHGRNAMAAYMALGTKPFNITRVAFGSGRVNEDANLADVHEPLEYVTDGAVADRRHQDDRLLLTVQYANSEHEDVKTFLLSEFVVYVEDPETGEETDFLYGTLGDYRQPVPAYNPAFPPSVFNFQVTLILSDELQVYISAPAGLVTYGDLDGLESRLMEAVSRQSGVLSAVITIPASAWQASKDGPCAYCAEVPFENATNAHIPYVSLDSPSMAAAQSCGLCDKTEAADGLLRFWADSAPAADMIARAALFGPGGRGSGSGYALPAATADTPGVVKPGAGLTVSSDGTLSVDTASEAEVHEMLDGVFAPDNK